MKNKLIFVEGIPGSGKSTLSSKLSRHISRRHTKSILWHEGGYHPANLIDWSAIIPLDELDDIITKYPKYEEKIRANMYVDNGYAVIFTKFHILKKEYDFIDLLRSYAICGGNGDFDLYSSMHFNKWKNFSKDAITKDEITIFECAFLQEHITELMMFREKTEAEILDYMQKLTNTVISLEPLLIYLQQKDVRETLRRVSETRLKEGWADRVIKMTEDSPYGKALNLKGFDGMVEFFIKKKEMDHKIMEALPVKSIVIDNDDYNWDDVWKQIKDKVDREFLV